MRNLFKIALILSLLTVVFVSCGNDDEGVTFSASYGTVETREIGDVPGRYFAVRLDNGTLLVAMDALVPIDELKNNDRIVISYTILGNVVVSEDSSKSYYVRVNNYHKLLSKLPVYQSQIGCYPEEGGETEATLGDDPVKIGDVWLGGKYMNIKFSILREQWTSVKHRISLVYNDVEPTFSQEGDIAKYEFVLRHNGYEDTPTLESLPRFVFAGGFVSFDIASIMREQGDNRSVEVKLIWYDYNIQALGEPVRMEKSGVFTFTNNGYEQVRSASMLKGDIDAYIE